MSDKDELIKTEILNAAEQLFGHFGWTKTTMEDIAKAAGKGKSTLYYYYKSKEEIFDEVVKREMNEVFRMVKTEVEKANTAEEKLRTFCYTKLRIVREKENLHKVIHGEVETNIPRLIELNRKYEINEISLISSILEFGLQRQEFAQYAAVDVHAIAFTMVCAFRGIEVGLIAGGKFDGLEARMDMIINILMRGLKA